MRRPKHSAKDASARQPWKLLLWATLVSLLFSPVALGEILEDGLRVWRNLAHIRPASGEIVFVGIDEESRRSVGEWPWPRATQARLIDEAYRLGAKRVFLDVAYAVPTREQDDRVFADALEKAAKTSKVVLALPASVSKVGAARASSEPLSRFSRHSDLASIQAEYNYQAAIWRLPLAVMHNGREVPGFSSALAGKVSEKVGNYRVDYSIDSDSIPYLSAGRLATGTASRDEVAGKTLVLGVNTDLLGDQYWVPGSGRLAGAIVQILGAETLKNGHPVNAGWLPLTMLTLLLVWVALRQKQKKALGLLFAWSVAFLAGSTAFEAHGIFVDVISALSMVAVVTARLGYVSWRNRELTNEATGLPNLTALRRDTKADISALVAVRVRNFAEIASTLSSDGEGELARQIAGRLSAGGTAVVYQGDEGIFAWYADPHSAIGNHLEALHALFRSPIRIEKQGFDLALSFGVELGNGRRAANRLGSALVAAAEAWDEGLKWKYYDPARQEQVSWRLSLLGELDAAIDNGEVWIAYQPQLDLTRRVVVGAEALARWTHPEKGPISPIEFIAAAEQQGRIGKLTDFVLDRAISTAAAINRRGMEFTIAVNVSARLLSDRQLIGRVQTMLKAHGLQPERLTLELTETEALTGEGGGIATLDALRASGVRIAIDDYGTGLSTLDYLKKVPANEIKIDQSFVKAMRFNRSDLIMVQSTIALAHSLGRTVVAEGVEDQQCLDELSAMGCDVAQGFVIGRPMGTRELIQRLEPKRTRRVA